MADPQPDPTRSALTPPEEADALRMLTADARQFIADLKKHVTDLGQADTPMAVATFASLDQASKIMRQRENALAAIADAGLGRLPPDAPGSAMYSLLAAYNHSIDRGHHFWKHLRLASDVLYAIAEDESNSANPHLKEIADIIHAGLEDPQ